MIEDTVGSITLPIMQLCCVLAYVPGRFLSVVCSPGSRIFTTGSTARSITKLCCR